MTIAELKKAIENVPDSYKVNISVTGAQNIYEECFDVMISPLTEAVEIQGISEEEGNR